MSEQNPGENKPVRPLVVKQCSLRENKPDLEAAAWAVLKNGPRVRRVARLLTIRNRHTDGVHHHALKIESVKKGRTKEEIDEKRSVYLDSDEEIGRLATFLNSLPLAQSQRITGNYVVAPVAPETNLAKARQAVAFISTGERANLLVDLIEQLRGDSGALRLLVDAARANPEGLRAVAAALNLGRFTEVLRELEHLIAADAAESEFQKLLSANPWIFGSEYSARVDQRRFTRDEQQDFMLRRTVDGYLEIIEIKTPLQGKPLFNYDNSHDSFYPRSELSEALGQVMKYLEKLDAEVNTIKVNDGVDVAKIRARLIIGHDAGDVRQKQALRRFNAHLHRVEVLTFDQLLRIGRQVVDALSTGEQTAANEVVMGG
jgi:hypothetical protein